MKNLKIITSFLKMNNKLFKIFYRTSFWLMSNKKIIIRLKGGLGNQLFIYAFGYSLAKENSYNLVLDYLSGFVRDYEYKRFYLLDNFQLTGNLASKKEMLFPFERAKRGLLKFHNFFLSNNKKYYLTDKDYNENRNINFSYKKIYLDGLWQNKNYFSKFYEFRFLDVII